MHAFWTCWRRYCSSEPSRRGTTSRTCHRSPGSDRARVDWRFVCQGAASGLSREVVGFDLDARSRELAVELGVVDRCADTLAEACRDANVIQLATPILALERLLGELAKLDLAPP